MLVRIDGRDIKLPTRTGLDWSHRYPRTIEALGSLKGLLAHSKLEKWIAVSRSSNTDLTCPFQPL
jgi:hypothetical protein